MVEVAAEGDQFEVRGPFGGWFVWDASQTRPLFLDRGRLRAGAADVDAAPPPQRGQRGPGAAADLRPARPTTCSTPRELETIGVDVTSPTRAGAGGLDGLRPPRRPRDARRGGLAPGGAHLRLRADGVRRDGRQPTSSRSAQAPPGSGPSASARRMMTMEHLDGNAAAGELSEIFTPRRRPRSSLRRLRGDGPGRRGDGLRGRDGHGVRCADCSAVLIRSRRSATASCSTCAARRRSRSRRRAAAPRRRRRRRRGCGPSAWPRRARRRRRGTAARTPRRPLRRPRRARS